METTRQISVSCRRGAKLKRQRSIAAFRWILLCFTLHFLVGCSGPPPIPMSDGVQIYDWRNVGGKNYTTPVVNQGSLGACAQFAEIAALETIIKIRRANPDSPVDLSEQFALSCAAEYDGNHVSTRKYNEGVDNLGITDQACFPNRPVSWFFTRSVPCRPCPDWKNRIIFRGVERHSIPPHDAAAMKKAIIEHGPIVAGMDKFTDMKFYLGGIYRHRYGGFTSGHVVMVCGFNDKDGYWVLKNSGYRWWGENGFMRLAYGECNFGQLPYWLEIRSLTPEIKTADQE